MPYTLVWSNKAAKELGALGKKEAKRIVDSVKSIVDSPFLSVKKLSGYDLYSLRVGDYRVLMSIEGANIVVHRIGHRRDVYKRL